MTHAPPSAGTPLLEPGVVPGVAPARLRRDLHFDLGWLGPEHETAEYTLRASSRRWPLRRHSEETLRAAGLAPGAVDAPTHFAEAVETDPGVVQLVYVQGPPDASGFPTLASVAVNTPTGATVYTASDLAQAVVFMNPTITMLTPATAATVLGHVAAADTLPEVTFAIRTAGKHWATPRAVLDGSGKPVIAPSGKPYFTYELHSTVLNSTAPASAESKAAIYSDTSLQGTRWNLLDGVSHLDVSAPPADAALATRAQGTTNSNGYSVALQDGGPNFGLSVTVNGLSDDFVLDLTVTNSYVRHTSVFVSFLDADGNAMQVPDNVWTALAKGAMAAIVQEWLKVAQSQGAEDLLSLLTSSDNTLWWCGNVNAESTFLGIPVSSTNIDFTFGIPQDQGTVGRIRLLVGSLGTNSHLDWDPTAAWLGLSLTALIDLAIPTYGLITTAGEESNTLFDSIFKDVTFLLPTAYSVFLVAKDLITGSANTGNDLSSALTSLADSLVSKVLTSAEAAAKLAGYFGAEEAEEAVPFVGWALKVLAMEGTVAQLAQTVGEVIGSPRVVEFDMTVVMNAQITLTPDASTGGEFPATATSFSITAQYSGNTTRTYTGTIADPKVSQIVVEWDGVPAGGSVTFVVAMFSAEGWGVGKGQSATLSNLVNGTDVNGNPALVVEVSVQQELYPLDGQTTYQHQQLLTYGDSGDGTGYFWQDTATAPTETAQNLGTGPTGEVLQALNGITLSDDLGILGYSWEASGLGIPPVGGQTEQTELYTMQNIGFKPLQGDSSPLYPQAGYMTAPEGYDKGPLLLYLRTAAGAGPDDAGPGLFFLDPSGDGTNGFHLRQVTPVTDPGVPMDDPSRQFDLATGNSWGRFALLPTSMAIHSNGYVVAVNPASDNVQILQLPAQSSPDAQAPWAYQPLGPGTAPGRVSQPALVAISPDQTILVLEAGNQRIQAFSRGGHPVQAFTGTDTPYWIPLVSHAPAGTSVVYLSMSVDVAGYVYVLSQNGNGYDASDFNLDIYTPEGEHLVYQQGLVAAGMAVDLWRNLYTLNFQKIAGPGGRTEPSLSEYVPSTPASA